jgi:formimidoylglutamate deiminase
MKMNAALKYFRFQSLYRSGSWLSPAYVGVDNRGVIRYIDTQAPDNIACEFVAGYTLPGFVNAHSHAFQFAMAGHAEQHPAGAHDDFWSWREAMYACALAISPEQLEEVAANLYAELLRNGFTHVAEFHYLHHDPAGRPYANRAEMAERLIAAAVHTGIKLTLIPVFYQQSDFGKPIHERQRRFYSATVDDFVRLWEDTARLAALHTTVSMGTSVHSLRAATPEAVLEVIKWAPSNLPFHLHVAEQVREVENSIKFSGLRPMQWLLNQGVLSPRFFLVHSTHLDDHELALLPHTGATVVLCPSTEGNLGDGFFRMKEFMEAGGKWCVGTDSHIGLNPFEELRMIDYRQRLLYRQRNPLGNFPARYLVESAVAYGLPAVGRAPGYFSVGSPLDAVVLLETQQLAACPPENRLSTLVYSTATQVAGTLVNGRWVASGGAGCDDIQ